MEGHLTEWTAAEGDWEFEQDGLATYVGKSTPEQSHGICISKISFIEGEVKTTIKLPDHLSSKSSETSGSLLYGYQSPSDEYLVIGLGGNGCAYSLMQYDPAFGLRTVSSYGSTADLIGSHRYQIECAVRGRRVVLNVDGACILDKVMDTTLPGGQLGLFASGSGPIEFANTVIRMDPACLF